MFSQTVIGRCSTKHSRSIQYVRDVDGSVLLFVLKKAPSQAARLLVRRSCRRSVRIALANSVSGLVHKVLEKFNLPSTRYCEQGEKLIELTACGHGELIQLA